MASGARLRGWAGAAPAGSCRSRPTTARWPPAAPAAAARTARRAAGRAAGVSGRVVGSEREVTEYVSESGIQWTSGSATQRWDRALTSTVQPQRARPAASGGTSGSGSARPSSAAGCHLEKRKPRCTSNSAAPAPARSGGIHLRAEGGAQGYGARRFDRKRGALQEGASVLIKTRTAHSEALILRGTGYLQVDMLHAQGGRGWGWGHQHNRTAAGSTRA